MNILDLLQLILVGLALAGLVLGFANRWAVANHYDRLAGITSAGGNAAGRIREALNGLPPSTDAAAVKSALLAAAAKELFAEFDKSGPAIGATLAKIQDIIEGQLGQIPARPGAVIVQTTLDAAIGAIQGASGVPRAVPSLASDKRAEVPE